MTHMTRSGFVYYTGRDEYDESDNSDDIDFVQNKPSPKPKPKPKTQKEKASKKKKKKKKNKKKEKKPKKAKKPKDKDDSTELLKQITELRKENALLKVVQVKEKEKEVERDDWSNLLEDEVKCVALYRIGSQELYQLAGLLTPLLEQNASAITHSMKPTDQLLMVMDYIRGLTVDTICEMIKLPKNFAIIAIEKYLQITAEAFFSDTIKRLPVLNECRLFLFSHQIQLITGQISGLYLMIDSSTRKIRRYKFLEEFVEPRDLSWNTYQDLNIELNHRGRKEIMEKMQIYFPHMKFHRFSTLESASYFYIFITALWNLMLDHI